MNLKDVNGKLGTIGGEVENTLKTADTSIRQITDDVSVLTNTVADRAAQVDFCYPYQARPAFPAR